MRVCGADFFDKIGDAVLNALDEIGLPWQYAAFVGAIGLCCTCWIVWSSIWLTKRAYREQKERRQWHKKLDKRRNRRYELEKINGGGAVQRSGGRDGGSEARGGGSAPFLPTLSDTFLNFISPTIT